MSTFAENFAIQIFQSLKSVSVAQVVTASVSVVVTYVEDPGMVHRMDSIQGTQSCREHNKSAAYKYWTHTYIYTPCPKISDSATDKLAQSR